MDVVVTMLALVLLFVGTHIGLATEKLRSRLVAALGEWGFLWLYFGIAASTFALATVYYADHRMDGPPGLALGLVPGLREVLITAVVVGITAMVASFWTYDSSPYSLDRRGRATRPRGLERVTRHPFFAGLTLFAIAHALLATHAIGAVLMLALAALATVGSWHQDRKLARARGKPFADYLEVTSAVPFAAIASGRQTFEWREISLTGLAAGLAVAAILSRAHEQIFAYHGLGVIAVIVGGALSIAIATLWKERRRTRARRPSHDAAA
jgi:uncharacterized membrane protein